MHDITSQSSSTPIYSTYRNDPEFAELLELFAMSIPGKVRDLTACFDEERWEELRVQAHQLKGAAGGYGFFGLTELAAALEQSCRTGDRSTIAPRLNELIESLNRISV